MELHWMPKDFWEFLVSNVTYLNVRVYKKKDVAKFKYGYKESFRNKLQISLVEPNQRKYTMRRKAISDHI